MPTTVAICFALGFYLVTLLGVTRTQRMTGRNPVIIFRTGSPEEIAAVVALWLFPIVLILSTMLSDVGLFRMFINSWWLQAAGAALLLGGLVLQYRAIVTLGRAFSIGLDAGRQTTLVRHGPYRYVRHPIYAAFIGFFIGAWMLQPSRFFTIVMPIAIARVVLQAMKEERLLLATFGDDYGSYMEHSRRFVPWIV